MPSETLFDKNRSLEVGELLDRVPTPGVTPMPQKKDNTPRQDELCAWILKEVTAAERHVRPWQEDARLAYKFVAGDQYDPETRRMLRMNQRPDTAFNTLQKYLRCASGLERRSPQALLFQPTVQDNVNQAMLGEAMTMSYEWAINRTEGSYERSRAFEDTLTGGLGWTDSFIDKQTDPRGLIGMRRISPFEMYWPDCADENLWSTRWRARESLIDCKDAMRRWPDKAGLIKQFSPGTDGLADRPEVDLVKYTVPYIETEPITREGPGKPDGRGKVKVLEFQWFEDQDGYMFPDPVTNEPIWMSEKDYRIYFRRLQVIAPMQARRIQVLAEKASHRVYEVIPLLERRFPLAEPKPLPGRFTYNVMTGHFDEALRQWYGFVRIFIDPQRYANTFFRQTLEIIAVGAKGGYIAEKDAFENPQQQHEFEDTASRPGSINIVATNALAEGRIKPKDQPQLPAAAFAMLDFCFKSMEGVSGLTTSMLGGEGGGQMPGVTMRQQQQASMVLLASEFDALSRYRKDEGRTIAALLGLIADGRLIRVAGPMGGQQAINLLRQPFTMEYDLMLDDTESDPSLRKQYQDFILQAAPMLAKQGLFVPEMFWYMNFPTRIKQALIQQMQAAQQQQQEAAAKGINLKGRGIPRDPREVQAKIEKLQSDAFMHRARGQMLLSDTRREDVRTILEELHRRRETEKDARQHQLDREKHHADVSHKEAQSIANLLQVLRQPQQGGGDNGG